MCAVAKGPAVRSGLGERLEVLGLRLVLLTYWGAVSMFTRRRGKSQTQGGESVRPKG